MEVTSQFYRPVCCRRIFPDRTHLKIKPFLGFFPHGSSPCKDYQGTAASYKIVASADYSRRRPRKGPASRPKGSASKGFLPRTPSGRSTQKKDQSDDGEKDDSATTSGQYREPDKKLAEIRVDTPDEKDMKFSSMNKENDKMFEVEEVDRSLVTSKKLATVKKDGQRTIAGDHEDALEKMEILTKGDGLEAKQTFSGTDEGAVGAHEDALEKMEILTKGDGLEAKQTFSGTDEGAVGAHEDALEKMEILTKGGGLEDKQTFSGIDEGATKKVLSKSGTEDEVDEKPFARKWSDVIVDAEEIEPLPERLRDKEDMDSVVISNLERDAQAYKQAIEALAEDNFSKGNTIFVYPKVVKPDQEIDVFLNRSISSLKNEPVILIMGAFNDWQWKSFTTELRKTVLNGDWWSCRVNVPKEAYKMDFVFFNGGSVYENNDKKDFCLPVEGGMDAFDFENFLLEEKWRELEKLAAEQAERERQAEEQRRIEIEKAAVEFDRAQAKLEVEKRRGMLDDVTKNAVKSVENVWYIRPSEFKGGDLVRLYYNKSSGPLTQATELWIHGGKNNWEDGVVISGRFIPTKEIDGDWWYAHVMVPDRAFVLDWVLANGPPGSATLYDNNQLKDFHAIVPKSIPEELYWVEEEHRIFRNLQKERKLQEEAIRLKAKKTAQMKAETRERTMKTFMLSQKHIVYTEPLLIRAGTSVTIYYNPSNTVLNGKPEVWLRCSFNRWTHSKGPLPPQKMLPADNGFHLTTTVKVPLDAYMLDFVFSEKEDGGIYDNKNGMDYHIPVSGGVAKEPPMHIVHVSVEMAPIAKVGGLGDVVTSLSRSVQDLGHKVDIILPKYDCLNLSNVKDFHFNRSYHWGGTEIKVWFGKVEGLSVYFLEPQNRFFWAGCIYGCKNDGERFSFFCHAALEFLLQSGSHPEIIHCHDWSSAPVAWLFKENYVHYGLSKARVVFTIHNLEFGIHNIGKAMTYSDMATTVSPTYLKEVAGNPVIAPHLCKFHGILNGIDPDIWDPYNDKFIPVSYTPENVVEGKRAAKEELQQRLGLKKSDLPLVGIITRLTAQKGIHLIKHAIWRTLERNGQVVLLGSAPDPRIQNDFVNLANQLHSSHGDRARLCLTYDEPLSHLIYAGSDFILVPSIFEPCGLTQLTAMRYGSVPVVRKTGGLYDSVFDVDHDKERAQALSLEPNGFSFDGADAAGVDYALNRAISAWYDSREWFDSLCKTVMEQDWSWNRPALDYMELYYATRKGTP